MKHGVESQLRIEFYQESGGGGEAVEGFFAAWIIVGQIIQVPSAYPVHIKLWITKLLLRGLPPGYLAGIELRLIETEIALHRALSKLYNHSDAKLQEIREFPQVSKGELMEQWQELPLGSDIDLETWWSRKTKYVEPLDRECGPPEETSTPETHIAHGIDDIPSVDWEPTNERHRNVPDSTDSLTRETMASTVSSLPRPPNSVEVQKSPVDPQLQFESDIPDSSSWQRNSQMHTLGETITVAESFARAHHETYF
ncbi:hypothetical protein BCON_0444g00040 [Botryotinia convoluta]|uniref:Uncharacterized protein n=1 Tax=Botryotinia convoluta TaxID=54673 RepID=A0A4Z1HII9_9HELO|nr:hypothetical protein BCON_0444g00040 [Botryotinia convoluta]